MKTPDITAPIFGYNGDGKLHRAPIDVLYWLDAELHEARGFQKEFDQRAVDTGYDDYDNEISRHQQDGFVSALEYVKRYLENR
jgi:hypothetical protein